MRKTILTCGKLKTEIAFLLLQRELLPNYDCYSKIKINYFNLSWFKKICYTLKCN